MKKKTILFISGFVIISIVFAVGYTAGFIRGFQNAFWFDSPGKGLADTIELRQLRRGDINKVIQAKEDDLDRQILLHSEYLKKGSPMMTQLYFSYFADPRWTTAEKDHHLFMNDVVRYRNEYPIHFSLPEFTKDADESLKKEMKMNVEKQIVSIKKTLIQYGWKGNP